uniref:Uncharacterized protein n=1 Tax=Solanum lycopersicum TaxID=4081 RepID=A0A3Q7IUL7_SOLLC
MKNLIISCCPMLNMVIFVWKCIAFPHFFCSCSTSFSYFVDVVNSVEVLLGVYCFLINFPLSFYLQKQL